MSSSTPWLDGLVSRASVTRALSASSHGLSLESAGSIPIMGALRSRPWMAPSGERRLSPGLGEGRSSHMGLVPVLGEGR